MRCAASSRQPQAKPDGLRLRRDASRHPALVLDREKRPEIEPVEAGLVEEHVEEQARQLPARTERDEDVADEHEDDPPGQDGRQKDLGIVDDREEEREPEPEREEGSRQIQEEDLEEEQAAVPPCIGERVDRLADVSTLPAPLLAKEAAQSGGR